MFSETKLIIRDELTFKCYKRRSVGTWDYILWRRF